ncbi:TonB-dependent receptor [Parasalinivibrio latis]|uniref:TonB-dependent receptor n=1 Tax=Parasalinivibrio latis TaxID=2952610 RepID=UPI0030E05948
MKKALLSVAVASLLAPAYVSAEDTMVVIGRSVNNDSILDIPANISVISADDIETSGATSLENLLRGKAGIQISDTNSGPVFSLRGFSGSNAAHNTLILVDGRRLNKFDLSAPQISSIPLNQIERVEILSGSAGVLYGDQAVGGVINIVTKVPTSEGGSVRVEGGSFDTRGASANVAGPINEYWRYYFSGSQRNSDNYRKHNESQAGSILGRIQFDNDVRHFFAEASYYDYYRQYAGSLTEEEFKKDPRQMNNSYPDDDHHEITRAARIGFRQEVLPQWDLSINLVHDNTTGSGTGWGSPNNKTTKSWFGSLQMEGGFNAENGKANVILGIDASNTKFDYFSSSIDRDTDQNTFSVFGLLDYPVLPGLTLSAGARYAKADDSLRDKKTYPQGQSLDASAKAVEVGANYVINDSQRVYLRYDQSFRFAKVDEQAFTPSDVVGLKPQKGQSIEAGWDIDFASQSVRFNVYRLDLEDEIVYDSNANPPPGASFPGANVNADKSRRYGGSVNWDWYVTDEVTIGAEYNRIDGEFTGGDNKGKQLSWVSENTGLGYVSYAWSPEWTLYIEGNYTGSRYPDGDNSNSKAKLKGYWLGNIALNYTRGNWQANVRVDNAFDEKYASSVNNWGAYYSGTGRSFSVTGSYNF